jgi:proline dehydrogenase
MPKEHNLLKGFVFRLVKGRIAGSTLSSVLQETRENTSKGVHTTVTFLNDVVDDATKARYNANAYIQLAKQASRLHLDADLSVRLSQIGFALNNGVLDMCLSDIMKTVKDTETRVWIEAEKGVDTNELFEIYRKCRAGYSNVGIEIPIAYNLEVSTIKKNLRANDLVKLTSYSYTSVPMPENGNENNIEEEARKEAAPKKWKKGKNGKAKKKEKSSNKYVYESYISNIAKLLQADVNVAVLESDEKLISKIAGFSKEYKKNLIFELPLGYSGRKLNKLMKMNINLSIYTPYGKDWTSYVVNRLTVGHGRIRSVAAKVLEGSGEEIADDEEE